MITGDLSGIEKYVGSVGGILSAIEDPGFKGDFTAHIMNHTRKSFMTAAISANRSGAANISHVFEWPRQGPDGVSTGVPSDIPLFKLTKKGHAGERVLSFDFLQSTQPVPLPDPNRYGFKAEKLSLLRRHVFKFKAIIMETDSAVEIAPTNAKKLFIPDERNDAGYYMTSKPQTINPGGPHATGGFAEFWRGWFEGEAPEIVKTESARAAEYIKLSGQTVIRYAAGTTIGGQNVGGRFAKGSSVSFGYVNAARRTAQIRMREELKNYYPEEEDW